MDTLISYASVFDKTSKDVLNTYCSATATAVQRHLFDVSKSSTYGNVVADGWPFDITDFQYFVSPSRPKAWKNDPLVADAFSKTAGIYCKDSFRKAMWGRITCR